MNYVKYVIDNWDPIDLLSYAPNDEYHSEIEKIQRLLYVTDSIDELTEGIFKVFVESFGKEIFCQSKQECKQIAQELFSMHRKIGDG